MWQQQAQAVGRELAGKVEAMAALLVRHGAARHLPPLSRQLDDGRRRLAADGRQSQRRGVGRPAQAEVLRPPRRELDPPDLEPLSAGSQAENRRVADQRRPAGKIVTRLDPYARDDILARRRQFEREGLQWLFDGAGVDEVAEQQRRRARPCPLVHAQHRPAPLPLDADLDALDAGGRGTAQREQGQRQQRRPGARCRRLRQPGVRHRLAGSVEHPQVAEIRTADAGMDRRRQLDAQQWLWAVRLQQHAESEVARRFGESQDRPQQAQAAGKGLLHGASSFGGAGAR